MPAVAVAHAGETYDLHFQKSVRATVRLIDGIGQPVAGHEIYWRYRSPAMSRHSSFVRISQASGALEEFRPGEEVEFYYLGHVLPARTPIRSGETLSIRLGEAK